MLAGKLRAGGIGASVSITNQTLTANSGAGTATCTYRLNSSGVAERGSQTNFFPLETWLLFGAAASYDARVTMITGTLTSGTVGSWLNLGSTQSWAVSDSVYADGAVTCSFTVEIRNASSLVVLDSATISLTAEYF